MTINYISLCSGYGAECLALKRLRHDHPGEFGFNLLAWAEIEPYACASTLSQRKRIRGITDKSASMKKVFGNECEYSDNVCQCCS